MSAALTAGTHVPGPDKSIVIPEKDDEGSGRGAHTAAAHCALTVARVSNSDIMAGVRLRPLTVWR